MSKETFCVDIEGYEDYFVDIYSNIVSKPKLCGEKFINKYLIMKTKINRYGYEEVTLVNNKGDKHTFLVHRLVAKAFIPNPDNLPVVNHKNGIKTDNRIENLEWCTYSENTRHAYENNINGFADKVNANIEKINSCARYKKIILIKDNVQYEFDSISKASKFCDSDRDNITRAIRKKQRVNGYIALGQK